MIPSQVSINQSGFTLDASEQPKKEDGRVLIRNILEEKETTKISLIHGGI